MVDDAQMAKLALQLLSRVQIQMPELDAAIAVREWLTRIAQQHTGLNGSAERPPINPS